MEIVKDVYISFVIAGKVIDEKQRRHLAEVNPEPPCCGRCWFLLFPSFRFTNIGWDFSWLFYNISYDNFRAIKKHKRQKDINEL
jgi:hypothetical protein